MKLFSISAVLGALLVLSACAADSSDPAARPGAPRLASQDAPTITGSRIPARRTEKMVGATTGRDYEENVNANRAPLISN